jgi:hypothetical protein
VGAEFYVSIKDRDWQSRNLHRIEEFIRELSTFVSQTDGEFRLRGPEDADQPGRWAYDLRVFTRNEPRILLEISSRPQSVEDDLRLFLSWLREQVDISVDDEDGEPGGL